jgi:lipopolysaccharide exporter
MNQETKHSQVISGVGWSSISSIVSYILLFVKMLVLVRILAPEDFGIIALSLLLVTIIKQFSNIGLEQAVIQKEYVDKTTINTIWTVSIIRGFLFFVIINLLSPHYAAFFNEPKLVIILTILSFSTIANGFKNGYISLAEKELKFDVLFKLVVISTILEFIVTIILALIYKNVIALAIGYLVSSLASLALSYILLEKKPELIFSYSEFLKLFKFGKWVFTGGVLIFLILNIDITIIGKLLGVAMLGYYQVAYRFGNFAATDIVLSFSRSVYPSFSLVKDDLNVLRNYFLTTVLIIAIFILPIMVILELYAESFIYNFIGLDWEPAIMPLKILIVFGIIRCFAAVCGYVFWAVGKPKIQSYISFIQLALILIIIYPLTINFSIEGAAIAITIPLFITSIISYYFVNLELKIKANNYIEYFYAPFLGVISLMLAIYFMQSYFGYIDSALIFIVNFVFLISLYGLFVYTYDHFGNKKIGSR